MVKLFGDVLGPGFVAGSKIVSADGFYATAVWNRNRKPYAWLHRDVRSMEVNC